MRVKATGELLRSLERQYGKNSLCIEDGKGETLHVNKIEYHPPGNAETYIMGLEKIEKRHPEKLILICDTDCDWRYNELDVRTVVEILKVFQDKTPFEVVVKSGSSERSYTLSQEHEEDPLRLEPIIYATHLMGPG